MADKSKGLITLLRDIQGHWIWKYKPFSKGQAWVDMLLFANHQDQKVALGNNIVLIKRGEFITSQFKLAEKWGWGRQQVRAFLKLLEHPNPDLPMITCQNLTKKATKITILNYSELQKFPTKSSTNAQPTHNQDLTTNNKYKNDNNDKNKDISQFEYLKNNTFLTTFNDYLIMRQKIRKPATEKAKELALKELHKHDLETATAMLEQSIFNSWQGIFPLKRKEQKDGKSQRYIPESLRENQEERRKQLEQGTRIVND